MGATEWFRQAHNVFNSKTGNRCPYCATPLPNNFEDTVKQSFDDSYKKNLDKLTDFFNTYSDKADKLLNKLSQIPSEIHPTINIKIYNDKLNVLKAILENNTNIINKKISEPNKILTLSETKSVLEDLSNIIADYNKIIDENNTIITNRIRKSEECKKQVFEYMNFIVKDILESYNGKKLTTESEIKDIEEKITKHENEIIQFNNKLNELRKSTVNTETAINNINAMLRDVGFQGFEIRPQEEHSINYKIIRTETGEIASDLSEGEKNFIAFLYFQQKVYGNETIENDIRQKIVVIDDPVSSLDSNSLFIVGEQIRKMIEICKNRANNRDACVKGSFIVQIFILTHNVYFHREITYSYIKQYDFVSLYFVKKSENKSSITLCTKSNPDEPSEYINFNPIKNSYAALWEEYKETQSTIPLINVIRRIIEYYFIQICGYDKNYINHVILEKNKNEYMHDEQGNMNSTKFDMAKSMLYYITSESYGINDGLHFIDYSMDVNLCKKTFEMIFKHMNQEQHFNMMMDNSISHYLPN